MKIYILIFIILVIIVPFVSAAKIEGKVYDFSLNLLRDVVIEVNSIPLQKHLSLDGSYSFELSEGNYTIKVMTLKGIILSKEDIKIKNIGNYNLDLIIFPEITSGLEENNDTSLEEINNLNNNTTWLPIIIIISVIVVLILYNSRKNIINFIKSKNNKESENNDPLLEQVLSIIKKESRINQKDLRKHFPLSEAKISLVISELEAKGRIEKIKKGRGNIIIFKN